MAEPNSTPGVKPCQQSIYPAPFLVCPANLMIEGTCAHAKTWTGRIVGGDGVLICGVCCKRWSCRPCAAAKIKKLAVLCRLAGPNRLLTLTVDPKNYQSPRHAFEATAAFVPELIRTLRKRFGQVEYLRVTELHKSGYPHYHLLVKSSFLPHAVVKNEWHRLTNNQIVDLRQVDGSFQSYTYLTKYLSKLHRLEWTDRHVSYSKNFFPPAAIAKTAGSDLADGKLHNEHPFGYLARFLMGWTLTQTAPLTFIASRDCPPPPMHREGDF